MVQVGLCVPREVSPGILPLELLQEGQIMSLRCATGSLQMAISTLSVTRVFACLFCQSKAEPSGL